MRPTIPLLAVTLLALGCQSKPAPVAPVVLDDQPLVTPDGQRRSLAFESPYQRTLAANNPAPGEAYDWWADRNDARAATYSGYELPTFLYSHTRSVDRVSDYGGEPRTSSTDTTYRGRIRRGVR